MNLNSIQNLIFDLGGVILDLHVNRTHESFAKAVGITVEETKAMINESPFFNEYEKGLITDDEFRTRVRSMLKRDLPNDEIDKSWNAMLGGIPAQRLQLLQRLRSRYRIFLLSNTNSIHLRCFGPMVQQVSGEEGLHSFFEVAYYSHILKMRKPDLEIYEHVIRENQLAPEVTLFLDDHPPNLDGAARAGIKTFHVLHPDKLLSLFHEQ